jgi:hypothetical protein
MCHDQLTPHSLHFIHFKVHNAACDWPDGTVQPKLHTQQPRKQLQQSETGQCTPNTKLPAGTLRITPLMPGFRINLQCQTYSAA